MLVQQATEHVRRLNSTFLLAAARCSAILLFHVSSNSQRMVIIASSLFMHKTTKRQCLHDKEGKGCPHYANNCANNTQTTFMHKARDLPTVCICPAQLGLDGQRMTFHPSLVLRLLANQGSSTSRQICPKPASTSFMIQEAVQNCPVSKDVLKTNPPMTMSSSLHLLRMHTSQDFYTQQTKASYCTLKCFHDFESITGPHHCGTKQHEGACAKKHIGMKAKLGSVS